MFTKYTQNEQLLFKRIFAILSNLSVHAKTSTDIGFMRLFQSLLILQGATMKVKSSLVSKKKILFQLDDQGEKPLNLEKVQQALMECGAGTLVISVISLSYQKYGHDKSEYFAKILNECLNLGSSLMSYGNREI